MQQVPLIFVSGHCVKLISKIYQTVASISSKTSQFHKFFDLIFGGILSFWPNCETESAVVAGFWIPVVVKIKLSKESRKRGDVAGLSDPGGQGAPPPPPMFWLSS